MGLESSPTKIADLVPTWPLGGDARSLGDDHIRNIKNVMVTDVVSKSGGTMSGNLYIEKSLPQLVLKKTTASPATLTGAGAAGFNRWTLEMGDGTVETGSGNTGSDFSITRYADDGVPLGTPLVINRATGLGTVSGDPTANLGIATKQYVDGLNTNINNRVLRTGDTMTGALQTVGLTILQGTDGNSTGVGITLALKTTGLSEALYFSDGAASQRGMIAMDGTNNIVFRCGDVVSDDYSFGSNGIVVNSAPAGSNAALWLNKPASGQSSLLVGQTAGKHRWYINLADGTTETGTGNTGSNFTIFRYDDDGTTTAQAMNITRSTRDVTFYSGVASNGTFGTTAAGTINLRPNGIGSTTNQTTIASTGNMTVAGSITSSATGIISSSGTFTGATASIFLGPSAAGTIYLRPLGSGNASSQTTLDSTGMIIAGTLNSGAITSTGQITAGGKVQSTQQFEATGTTATLAATGSGTINLRPLGVGDVTVQTVIDQTNGMTITNSGNSIVTINKGAGVFASYIFGKRGAVNRWRLALGDATAESSGNVGSDFWLQCYDDAGTTATTCLSIIRSTQDVTITNGGLKVVGGLGINNAAIYARQALALPTGTISRATYATSTVTLPILAGVVMAIITDLRGMGFFS